MVWTYNACAVGEDFVSIDDNARPHGTVIHKRIPVRVVYKRK